MTEDNPTRFYVVSMGKFTLLFFATMGFYSLYWFYQAFRTQQEIRQRELYPFLRTLVAIFFVHSLFHFIRGREQQKEQQSNWSPGYLAWVYIGVGIFQLIAAVIMQEAQPSPLWRIFVMMVALLVQFYTLYQVQLVVNRMEGDPFGKSNRRMDFKNQLWMAFGAYIWASLIFGVYLEVTGKHPAIGSETINTGDSISTPAY